MYILVIPFDRSFDELGFTYLVPGFLEKDIKIGQILEIPFGNHLIFGICVSFIKKEDININLENIKPIVSVKNSNIFLNNYQLDLVNWIAKYYFSPIHNSLNLFLPRNLKEKIIKDKLSFEEKKEFNYSFNFNKKLNTEQDKAYSNIKDSKNNKILLYGLTGSGKTEIYIKLIKDYINTGKQVLLLIPEIILTSQLLSRIKNVFGDEVIAINSTITEATKTKNWVSIYNSNAKIVIGTRSALFYPYNNLGLIIIDEEHDNSYKSDISPRYNTIEVAEKISEQLNIKLVLGSGTPSVNSMYKGVKNDYKIINLFSKYKK